MNATNNHTAPAADPVAVPDSAARGGYRLPDADSGADETTYQTVSPVAVSDPYGVGQTGWAANLPEGAGFDGTTGWVAIAEEAVEDFDPSEVARVVSDNGEPVNEPVGTSSIHLSDRVVTVEALIVALSELDQTAEVRLATQPNYPMQVEVLDVLAARDGVVWIVEAGHPDEAPYLPGDVAAAVWK